MFCQDPEMYMRRGAGEEEYESKPEERNMDAFPNFRCSKPMSGKGVSRTRIESSPPEAAEYSA